MTNLSPSHPAEVFSGREQELAQLQGYLAKAARGKGRFVAVEGEAGIGKAALLQHFGAGLVTANTRFFVERFCSSTTCSPYEPFLRILAKLESEQNSAAAPDSPAQNEEQADQAEWNAEALYALQSEQRLAQQRVLTSFLEAARDRVLVVALLGGEQASLSAWQFVHYLCESIGERKILLITSVRADPYESKAGEKPPHVDVLARMNRERLIEKMTLRAFDESELRGHLFRVFRKSDFGSRFVPALMELSAGVPRVLKCCLDEMVRQGYVYEQGGVWFNREDPEQLEQIRSACTDSHQAPERERLEALGSTEQKLLRQAALMRGTFTHSLLARTTGIPRIKTIKRLVALSQQGFLRQAENAEEYDFRNAATRDLVLQQISAEDALALHEEIANALDQVDEPEKSDLTARLAYHYSQTNNALAAAAYLRKAGDMAISNFAFPEGRDYLRDALSVLARSEDGIPPEEEVKLLVQAGWLERVLGNWQQALYLFETAEALTLALSDEAARRQIQLQKGHTYFRLNDWEPSLDCFRSCLESPEPFERAMAAYGMGSVFFEQSNFTAASEHVETAREIAKEHGMTRLLANIYNNLGAMQNVQGNTLRAIMCYSQSIPLFEKLGDHSGLARTYHNIGMSHGEQGDWSEANEFYGKSLRLSDSLGLTPLKSITFLNRALSLAHLQEFEDAEEYNFKAFRILSRLKDELGLAEYHKIQGVLERKRSNLKKAGEHFDEALEKFIAHDNGLGVAETEFEYGLLAQERDDMESFAHWMEKAHASFETLGIKEKAAAIRKQVEEALPGREVKTSGSESLEKLV